MYNDVPGQNNKVKMTPAFLITSPNVRQNLLTELLFIICNKFATLVAVIVIVIAWFI
jgi:hypothetical protein